MARTTAGDEVASAEDATLNGIIEQDPNKPGRHNARFVGSGTHVSVVLGGLRRNNGDVARTAREWDLPESAVRAAIRYYERHRALFDAYFLLEEEEYRCRVESCVG